MNPVRYRVLVSQQLHPVDQVTALAQARTVLTGEEATRFQGKPPWGCEIPDTKGRIRILRYKGAEVAVFLRREVTEIEPFPGDPVPVGILKDPSDMWVRFELLGRSSTQVAALSTRQRLQLTRDVETLRLRLSIVQEQFDTMETKLLQTQQALETAQNTIKKLRAGKVAV